MASETRGGRTISLFRPVRVWFEEHARTTRWLTILRLGLFQFGMGLSLAPITGALNRVLIDELRVPAVAVALLMAIHYFVSPVRAVIGFESDQKRAAGRWRTPYVILGAMLTYGGLACAPFALILLGGDGRLGFATSLLICSLIFLAYGVGVNIVETTYLALVSDITPPKDRGRVLAVLWMMLVLGTVVSSIVVGWLLQTYSHVQLIRVMQSSAVIFILLTWFSLWGQERLRTDGMVDSEFEVATVRMSLPDSLRMLAGQKALRSLFLVLFVATLGFAVHDVLLEPYGGQVLRMSVAATTQLTALWGMAMLAAIALAGVALWRGRSPVLLIILGCAVGAAGFLVVSYASNATLVRPFQGGVWLIGMGRGMFLVGSVALIMSLADRAHTGLFLGLWGVTQALAQGLGTIGGGLARDVAYAWTGNVILGYTSVYTAALALLVIALTLIAALRLGRQIRDGAVRSPWSGLKDIPGDQMLF